MIRFIEKSANTESLSKNFYFSINSKAATGKGLDGVLSKYRKINTTIHTRVDKKTWKIRNIVKKTFIYIEKVYPLIFRYFDISVSNTLKPLEKTVSKTKIFFDKKR